MSPWSMGCHTMPPSEGFRLANDSKFFGECCRLSFMTQTCTRRLQFCCGHRVKDHESKCAHLHGHNYVVEITARAAQLDAVGRVIDFSVLKARVGGWIEDMWDHGFVLWNRDDDAISALRMFSRTRQISEPKWSQKLYLMPTNPTAENMADYLLREICPTVLKDTGVVVSKVVVRETENCWAEASL